MISKDKEMALFDFILEDEVIKCDKKIQVEYESKRYSVIITDKRIILFATRGFLFKTDDIISEKLERFHSIQYCEHGIINKYASIVIDGSIKLSFKGKVSDLKDVYQKLQSLISV